MRLNYQENLILFLQNHLSKTQSVKRVLELLNGDKEILFTLLTELDMVISLFNHSSQFEKVLINANKLKKILGKKSLPDAYSVWDDLFFNSLNENDRFFKGFLLEFFRFKFIESMKDPKQLLACLIVAIYRTYMLVKYPTLKENKAQVASSLEEMSAIMALENHKTEIFLATKHWILDWRGEGFSKELAQRIKRHEKTN